MAEAGYPGTGYPALIYSSDIQGVNGEVQEIVSVAAGVSLFAPDMPTIRSEQISGQKSNFGEWLDN